MSGNGILGSSLPRASHAMAFQHPDEINHSSARVQRRGEDFRNSRTAGVNVFNDGFYSREDGNQYDRADFPQQSANHGFYDPINYTRENVTKDHSMWDSIFGKYVSRANSLKTDKPVVDLSRPLSTLSREDVTNEVNSYTGNPASFTWFSLSHFQWTPEISPYTNTYSTRDCIYNGYVAANLFGASNMVFNYLDNGLNWKNPQTAWAHRLNALMKITRFQAACAVGIPGYYIGYEFMYTHVPYLRIRDPRPNEWKKCWQDGQSTFLARMIAGCVFPTAAMMIYTGSSRSLYMWYPYMIGFSALYEASRWGMSGNAMFWKQMHHHVEMGNQQQGTLEMGNVQRIDPDTGRPRPLATYKQWTQDLYRQNTIDPEDQPGHMDQYKIKNSSYNPTANSEGTANAGWDLLNPLSFELYNNFDGTTSHNYNPRVIAGHSYGEFTTQPVDTQ